jgi:sn-glycerol 3-phosphate transport system substrate-binding protein
LAPYHESMKWMLTTLALGAVALMASLSNAAAPVKVTVWHYLAPESGGDLIKNFAQEFNASQSKYTVQIVDAGDYKTIQVKLINALRSGGVPSMTMVDNAFFTRLALGGSLEALDMRVDALPKSFVEDFNPVLWAYGDVKGQRFGLPWASSTLVNMYNADAFKQKNLPMPRSWDDYAKAAKTLTSRSSKGAAFFVDAWIFASMVSSRGGDILADNNRPDFNNPSSQQTLQWMYDLVRSGNALVRNYSEANFAILDWVRTKTFLVTIPTSVYPFVKNLVPFQIGAMPMPGKTLAGESQMVIPKAATDAERDGAFEFWNFLVKPENLMRFSKQGYYLPIRSSAARQLGDFANDPVMKAGLEALKNSYNPPHLIEYQTWRTILESQLERSLKGGVDPKAALLEAQRQSLAVK